MRLTPPKLLHFSRFPCLDTLLDLILFIFFSILGALSVALPRARGEHNPSLTLVLPPELAPYAAPRLTIASAVAESLLCPGRAKLSPLASARAHMAPPTPVMYLPQLSARELQALTEYKNRGEDRSLTYKYVMGPLYDRLVHFLPLWLAPNAVTLLGFILTVAGHILLMYYVPRLDNPAPRWVYIYGGSSLFVYMVLDNLDGRQARRTRSSSPLGHLFDHGCDAFNVTLSGMSLLATVQLGPGWMTATMLYSLGQLMVFAATLEEYFTGAMILREFNGPNEGLIMMSLLQITTGMMGPRIWTTPITIPGTGGLQTYGNHIAYYCGLFPIVHLITGHCVAVIRDGHAIGLSYPAAIRRAFSHSMSIIAFGLCFVGWSWLAPDTFAENAVPILWLSGFVLFDLVSRMILAHLAGAAFPFFPFLFIPLIACSTNAIAHAQFGISFMEPGLCLALTLGGTVLYNAWRIWCLITQLCDYLNVRCFSLRKLRLPEPDEGLKFDAKRR